MRRIISFISVLLIIVSCQPKNEVERGFYYWKSNYSISNEQQNFLNDIHAEVLYVHFFDVVMGEDQAVPIAEIEGFKRGDISVVPVVYITTDVFTKSDSSEIVELAEKVYNKIQSIYGSSNFSEVQIDCDWTPSIQNKYFYFLKTFKQLLPTPSNLSATVRLYQYKYPEIAGVPPVDKGLLMYYNMGDLTDYKESNSVLNNEIGADYLVKKKYPLPLDIALPNFSWALLFREGSFVQICPQFSKNQLKKSKLFMSDKEDHFIFTQDTVLYDTYFRFGDELRFESCTESALMKAAEMLNDKVESRVERVLIYHLQEKTIKDYEKLDAVFTAFE